MTNPQTREWRVLPGHDRVVYCRETTGDVRLFVSTYPGSQEWWFRITVADPGSPVLAERGGFTTAGAAQEAADTALAARDARARIYRIRDSVVARSSHILGAGIHLGHALFALNPEFDGGFGNPRRPVKGPAPDVAARHLTAAAAELAEGDGLRAQIIRVREQLTTKEEEP